MISAGKAARTCQAHNVSAGKSIIIHGDDDPGKAQTARLPCSGRITLGAKATAVVRGVRISGQTDSAISLATGSTMYAPGMPVAKLAAAAVRVASPR